MEITELQLYLKFRNSFIVSFPWDSSLLPISDVIGNKYTKHADKHLNINSYEYEHVIGDFSPQLTFYAVPVMYQELFQAWRFSHNKMNRVQVLMKFDSSG